MTKTEDGQGTITPLSITDRYAKLDHDLKSGQHVDGRVNNTQIAGQPVGKDAYKRRLEEVDKGIKERQARRIGRNDPDSIQY